MHAILVGGAAESSEDLVLCRALNHPEDVPAIVATGLDPAHFASVRHTVIAGAIWALHAAQRPVDVVTVLHELERQQLLAQAGGPEELDRLQLLAGTSANFEHHAREIQRLARKRRVVNAAAALTTAAANDDQPAVDRILAELADEGPVTDLSRIESKLLTLEQLRALPEPDWMIDGLLALDSLAMLFGKRGSKKSFAIIDLLMRASVGGRWHGRAVRRTRGLYVVGEGTPMLAQRFDAWNSTYPLHRPDVTVYPEAVNLMSTVAVADFAAVAARMGFQFIVFDTLARMMVGGDENSTKDAGIVVDNLDRIRRTAGACVTIVHHTGHTDNGRGRGSTAIEAGMDTVLGIADVEGVLTLTNTKQKNAVEAGAMRLDARTVHLQPAADGRPRSSLVLVEYAGSDVDQSTAATARTLQALADIELPGGIPHSRWMDAAEQAKSTFNRHLRQLVDLGLVRNIGTQRAPRYATVAALEAADPERLDLGA